MKKDKIYFASDFHLGSPNLKDSHKRERKIISWLCTIEKDAKAIYLVGDIFDFWFEYKKVVPKGFVRLQGKLAEMCDQGININFIVGNHDMWVNDYFQKEVGLNVFENEILIEENNQKICFAAPEAVCGVLSRQLKNLATKGKLKAVIIDEIRLRRPSAPWLSSHDSM